ncbi:SDR family oxidoreductase [Gracilibacillus caseinilyticus]|uniref:SDR family oxidoreductase n=1 Tax=Gracilibacillus caseinilyticus TaxID=2932256 RepID=A0ABY4EZS6_9BACI|nr:SDR family oxidoreductase [Gracilibacillus caseinilyticus]UOQ47681.1 SDR family oxidoreductase [Gracilibacillus caseinilyticus]
MNVLVIGANGQIGTHVVQKLNTQQGTNPVAMVRKQEQVEKFQGQGIETTLVDLEGSVADIADAMDSIDAVVFAAGSGGKTGADKTLLIDLDGAAKAVEAAVNKGVKRFVMVSAFQAHNRKNWSEQIKHYFVAKHHADRILEESTLDHTIIRPGALTNDAGTGKISIAENLEPGSVTREDVADTIIASLLSDNAVNQSFDLINGDTDIEEAVKNL